MNDLAIAAGRVLLGLLFVAGAVQKALDPGQVIGLLEGKGLPGILVWPALIFNAAAGLLLMAGPFVRPTALALAIYTAFVSWFHFLPDDGWQMSIFVKNWAIAGGLLVVFGTTPARTDSTGT